MCIECSIGFSAIGVLSPYPETYVLLKHLNQPNRLDYNGLIGDDDWSCELYAWVEVV